jgi:hypothetical protein
MGTTPTTYQGLVQWFLDFINVLIPGLFAFLFAYFLWRLIDAWIINADDERKRAEGKRFAFIAILMFVLMSSTWGLITIIRVSVFGF